ncbi:hypothetical protein FGO68_gene1807 [Halteria grandinella]|uniref:Uncharacterized protein n=1 Tax=Halteria grandinella TaxID=5974 RepID=A0A8J8NKB5_HALGN|nr:hypothetical protein FGO68_gene1807 [Halteria grandinella]
MKPLCALTILALFTAGSLATDSKKAVTKLEIQQELLEVQPNYTVPLNMEFFAMYYHWNGQEILPQYWDFMHGVNYKHVRMSADLNMIKTEMGNKTVWRDDHPLDHWFTDFINYNSRRQAFAQHSEVNTNCQISPFRPSIQDKDVFTSIKRQFVENYTYTGVAQVPWEPEPRVTYNVKERPVEGQAEKVQRIFYQNVDQKDFVRYIVDIAKGEDIITTKFAEVVDVHGGFTTIPALRRLFQFEDCLPY